MGICHSAATGIVSGNRRGGLSGEGGEAMALDMFLKLDGIGGEASDAKHKGEIDVLSWSWGLSEPAAPAGSGGGAGKVKIEDISIQKLVDLASPLLLSFSAEGKHIKEGTLTTRKGVKGGSDFLLVKLTDVIVTSVQISASKDAGLPAESITLGFGKVELDYRQTEPDGSLGTEKSFKWDVTTAKPG
jgi:type VI secretion system secreted protein Hcp